VKPLRICLVSAAYYPYPSGVTEHVHNLALSLTRLGQDVHILTTSYPAPRTPHPAPDAPFPVTRIGRARLIPMNRSYATLPVGLRMAGQVKRFFADNRFDVCNCLGMFWPEISYWALMSSNCPNVVTFLTAGFRLSSAGAGMFRFLSKAHLRRVHGLIPISNRAWQAFAPYVPGRPRIIPCGVDLDRFRPGLARPADFPSAGPVILFLGRLDRRKGLAVLIRAMPEILRAVPAARLLVVGQGPEEEDCRELTRELDIVSSVIFRGRVSHDELPRYYANCSVYCSPALGGETLGIVLLEAMAAGAPVVASDIPGYDETVRKDTDALLVPAYDPAALAGALIRVLSSDELKNRFKVEAAKRVQDYSWPRVAARTLDYYWEVIAGQAPGERPQTGP